MTNYIAAPSELKGKTSTQIINSDLLNATSTTIASGKNTIKKYLQTTMVCLVVATGMNFSSPVNTLTTTTKTHKTIKHESSYFAEIDDAISGNRVTNGKKNKALSLKETFGFNTAQWAAVLNVERKTIYDWESKPNTKIQQRVLDRINTVDKLKDTVDQEHLKYIPKFAFGKNADIGFANALTGKTMNYDDLIDNYYRLYSVIDGRFKRDKHMV